MKIFLKFYQKLSLISLLACLFSFQTTASNYYWIGGSGNWSDLNHWAITSGGTTIYTQIPTAFDDVFFDANSFTSSGQTVSFDPLTIFVHNINWTGVTHNPTMYGAATSLLKIYGSLTFVTAMNMNFAGPLSFEATTIGQTVRTAGKTFNSKINFNGQGGEWTLQDALTCNNELRLSYGTLNTNNQTVNAVNFWSAFDYTQVRALNMGSSVFNLSGENLTWWIDGGGITFNAGTSVINCSGMLVAIQQGFALTYHDINFTNTAPTAKGGLGNSTFHDVVFSSNGNIGHTANFHNVTIHGDATIGDNDVYNDLTFTAGHTYSYYSSVSGNTQTINGTFNANGTCDALIDIHAATSYAPTISHPSGPVNVSFVLMKDIHASVTTVFNANNSIDLGNNTGWNFNNGGSQNLYWIGNGGNWDDGNHWSHTSGGPSSGCAPTSSDNVFFDANSFSATGQTVSINALTAYCRDMNWTAVTNHPTLNGPASNLLKIYGSLNFATGMNMSFAGTVSFEATIGGKTILSAGKTFNAEVQFNGLGGEWTLQDSFYAVKISLNKGTLNTNNKTVTASQFQSLLYAPRALNMGSSVFNISGNAQCWWVDDSNFSLNCGTSVINCSGNAVDFQSAHLVYYDINYTNTSAGATGTAGSNNTFHDAVFYPNVSVANATFHNARFLNDARLLGDCAFNDLTFTAGHSYSLWIYSGVSPCTLLVNGIFFANGNCGGLIEIQSNVQGTPAIISHTTGTVNTSFLILRDITATGGATFIANSSVDLGNNPGWTINPSNSQNLYWVGNSGNWNNGAHWSFTSGGAPSGCSPTPLDNVFFDANSFSAPGQAVSVNASTAYCRNMTWTGVTNTPALTGAATNSFKIYGSLTFVTGMNMNFTGPVNFETNNTIKTIRTAGKSFISEVQFNGISDEWILQDAFSGNVIAVNSGTFTTNNQTVTAVEFNSLLLLTRTLNLGSSVFNLSGDNVCWYVWGQNITINPGTSVINCSGLTPNFRGDGHVYYNVNFTNTSAAATGYGGGDTYHDIVFYSNGSLGEAICHNVVFRGDGRLIGNLSFNDLIFTAGHTYTLYTSTNQANSAHVTINNHWQIQGTCTSYIVLQASFAGYPGYIMKSNGQVLGYNIHIKDIHCSGGANFIAYNSTDLGGNTGWNFSSLPPLLSPGLIVGPSSVCTGATGIVYHIPAVQGAIYYQWTVPAGATITSGQGDTLIVVNFGTAVSGDITVQSFNGCNYGVFSSTLTVVLSSQIIPEVTLSVNPAGPVCSGTPVTFTATVTNTNGNPVNYDFNINGISVQNGSSNIYSTTTLSNADVLTCIISVNGSSCYSSTAVTSNAITMNIAPGQTATISITADPPGNICSGTVVIFSATASNTGGGIVTYDFKVNSISVQNSSSNIYSTTTLSDGDIVSCDITINGGTCLASTTATSNTISMSVTPTTTPTIFISPANPVICLKDEITFTSTLTNGGSAPAYHWKLNGNYLQEFGSTFTTNNLHDGDIVTCLLSSNAACIFDATPLSNGVLVKVVDCECIPTIPNAITPNGDGINDRWIIAVGTCSRQLSVSVYNRYGSLVYQSDNYHNDWYGTYGSKNCPDGTYYYVIRAISQSGHEAVIKGNVSILR